MQFSIIHPPLYDPPLNGSQVSICIIRRRMTRCTDHQAAARSKWYLNFDFLAPDQTDNPDKKPEADRQGDEACARKAAGRFRCFRLYDIVRAIVCVDTYEENRLREEPV